MTNDELWAEYKATGKKDLRDELLIRYLPLVKFVAGRVSAGLPHSIEQADLVSYATFGLIDAIEKFDTERSIKFETYAITRIKGAIIDELRSIDWVPRSVRAKARSIEQAYGTLEAVLGRTPTDAEVATHLQIPKAELQQAFGQISHVGIASLDELVDGTSETPATLGETLSNPNEVAMGSFDVEKMKAILAGAVGRLGEREKIVLTLYYHENLTLALIGEVLGVTESRVCQIHTKAVIQLRDRLSLT